MTLEPSRPVLWGMTRMGLSLVVAILVAILASGAAIYFALDARDAAETKAEAAEGQAADVADKAQRVIDCVKSPQAAPRRCKDEAEDAEAAIDDVDVASTDGLSAEERAEVAGLVDAIVEAQPTLSEEQVATRVLRMIRVPKDGTDGSDGDSPTTAQVRAIVEAVYAADPPADGDDGEDGAAGQRGPGCVEEAGLEACRGPQGDKGEKGEASTVPGPQGDPGTALPGTYTCPDGQYVAGLTVTEDGAVQLDCRDIPFVLSR